MAIPKSYVERGLELAKGATVFGVPVEDLTRDELIAWAVNAEKRAERAIAADLSSARLLCDAMRF